MGLINYMSWLLNSGKEALVPSLRCYVGCQAGINVMMQKKNIPVHIPDETPALQPTTHHTNSVIKAKLSLLIKHYATETYR
jgi:hypothetical protein